MLTLFDESESLVRVGHNVFASIAKDGNAQVLKTPPFFRIKDKQTFYHYS